MTPKEKAQYIFDIYTNYVGEYDVDKHAKQCALIAVDEALNMFIGVHNTFIKADLLKGNVEDTATYKYWQEVKQEIEKL